MKIQVVKDGEIQGSFVATMITVGVFVMLFLGLLIPVIQVGWEKLGSVITTTYLGQLTAWLGYRGAKSIFGPQDQSPIQQYMTAPPKLTGVVGPVVIEPQQKQSNQVKEQEIITDLDIERK